MTLPDKPRRQPDAARRWRSTLVLAAIVALAAFSFLPFDEISTPALWTGLGALLALGLRVWQKGRGGDNRR